MQAPVTSERIGLDRSAEPWCGTFPGVGEVRVWADGAIEVTALNPESDDADTLDMREGALRHGWGEALSWTRRGFMMLGAGAVTPDPSLGCLLLSGDLHKFGRFIPELTARGWMFLSDRYTPALWSDDALVAHPRQAPILMSKRRVEKVDWFGTAVRGDTDTLAIEVPRVTTPTRVLAVASLGRGKVGDPIFEVLTGHRRFEAAATLRIGGALAASDGTTTDAPDDDPSGPMADQLRMAALPFASLHSLGDIDTIPAETDELVQWWERVVADRSTAARA